MARVWILLSNVGTIILWLQIQGAPVSAKHDQEMGFQQCTVLHQSSAFNVVSGLQFSQVGGNPLEVERTETREKY